MADYAARARELRKELIAYRRHLHRHPEVGLELPQTAAYITECLRSMGCEPERIGGSGVTALVGKPGKTILLRAETDALPMREESGLPFAAVGDAAHTCGHDLHAAALLGAARMLKENEDALSGTVKLLFQPGEEILRGAQEMIRWGILSQPKVDAAFGCHVTPRMATGAVAFRNGAAMASCFGFRIRIYGKNAHGASPEKGVDPINIGVHIHLALQELIARETSFQNRAVLTIGAFRAGSMANSIPGEAELLGTLRTYDDALAETLCQRVRCVAEKTAELFRGRAEVETLSKVPVERNDPAFARRVRAWTRNLLGNDVPEGELRTGSDDFAFYSEQAPSVLAFVGSRVPTPEGEILPGHHPGIIFDEEAIPVCAALYAEVAERWLREPEDCGYTAHA